MLTLKISKINANKIIYKIKLKLFQIYNKQILLYMITIMKTFKIIKIAKQSQI